MMLKRPKPHLLMMSFSIVAVLMLLLSACGASGTPTNSSSSSGTPVKGGTWIDDIPNEPGSLIPNADSQTFDTLVEQTLYAPLFVGDYGGHITLGAAAEMPTIANGDAIAKSADSLNPSVTSGPFKMSESVHGDHYTVVRNPNYYRASEGLPYLDKIIFRPIASEDTILKDLQAGSITSSWFLDVSKTP